MNITQGPKIYAGMLKAELLEIAERLGLRGVRKLKKAELIETIQSALRRPKKAAATGTAEGKPGGSGRRVVKSTRSKDGEAAKAAAAREPRPEAEPSVAPESSRRPEESASLSEQSRVTATKYRIGLPYPEDDLRHVDMHLPELPEGYGVDRVVLLPRDPAWLYAYWDIRSETRQGARDRGGQNLALRLFETVGGKLEPMAEHWCQELARSWYLPVPAPGRVYVAEVGYRTGSGSWLGLLRSNAVQVPPAGPSPIVADEFLTLDPDAELPRDLVRAAPPEVQGPEPGRAGAQRHVAARAGADGRAHQAAYDASGGGREAQPGSALLWPTSPGARPAFGGSPAGALWSGPAEVPGSAFWLVADAEVVVFGATAADASVEVGGKAVRLRPDGTFSVRMAFPDGAIDVPIVAHSADGLHERRISMRLERGTRHEAPTNGE